MADGPESASLRGPCARPMDHPDLSELRRFAELTVDWALRQEAGLADRPVGRSATPAEMDALNEIWRNRRRRSRTWSASYCI